MKRFENALLISGIKVYDLDMKCSDKEYPYLVQADYGHGDFLVLQVNEKGECSKGREYDLVIPKQVYKIVIAAYPSAASGLVFKIFEFNRLEEAKSIPNLKYLKVIEVDEEELI